MTIKKKPARKPATKPTPPDDGTDSNTDLVGSGSLALLLALLQASGVTLTAQQAAALTSTLQSSAGISATDTQNKTDVNVPEVITSLNGLVLANAVTHAKNVDSITLNTIKDNQENNAVVGQMRLDHRDQNHDKQINVDEQIAAVAAMYARFFATLNNPIPAA